MSYDLLFADNDGSPGLALERVAPWFKERGYHFSEVGQAYFEDGDTSGRTWIFSIGEEDSEGLSRKVTACLNITGYDEDRFFAAIREARAFCDAFDLLVCDPQGENLDFYRPDQYLVMPAGD